MKSLYIDCSMGAAGDMIMASLYELLDDRDAFVQRMNALGIPGTYIIPEKKASNVGIVGTNMKVIVNGEEEGSDHHSPSHSREHAHSHAHRGIKDIKDIIKGFALPDKVKEAAVNVFCIISEAESIVHGKPIDNIHFHEVGTYDAVADVTGSCLLMHMLGYPDVTASPVHVGRGTVKCAHGILPVPAPATALILQGVPIYGGEVEGELCTPTGAALLKYFVKDWSALPPMSIEKIGYGIGTKEFKCANFLRSILGEAR